MVLKLALYTDLLAIGRIQVSFSGLFYVKHKLNGGGVVVFFIYVVVAIVCPSALLWLNTRPK